MIELIDFLAADSHIELALVSIGDGRPDPLPVPPATKLISKKLQLDRVLNLSLSSKAFQLIPN